MDGAAAIGALRAARRAWLRHHRRPFVRREWLDRRCTRVADKLRHDRKRAADRDRGTLRFAHRPRVHLLVRLLSAETPAVAHVDNSVDFPRPRLAGERPTPPRFL